MVETHLIEAFVEVVQRGSVTAAAKALNRSQPAISHRLRQLEAVIGATLLEPDGRGVRLTDAGMRFHRTAAPLLAQLRALPSAAAETAPSLVVGVSHSLAALVAANCVRTLDQPLEIVSHTDATPANVFAERGYDGVFTTSPPPPDVRGREVGVWKLCLVRGTAESDARYLQWSGGEAAAEASRAAGDSFGLRSTLSVNSADVLHELVMRGIGRAILPAYVIAARPEEMEVLSESLDVRVYLWQPEGAESPTLVSIAESFGDD